MAPQVGQILREARTERGIELSEVERVTKIRVKFLQAMEEDRWEALPAPAYARGFLSIYARFLGLDEKALLDQYEKTVEGADRHEPIPQTVIHPGVLRQSRPSRPSINLRHAATVLAGVVVVGVLALVIVGSIGGSSNGGGGGHKDRGGKSTGADGSDHHDSADVRRGLSRASLDRGRLGLPRRRQGPGLGERRDPDRRPGARAFQWLRVRGDVRKRLRRDDSRWPAGADPASRTAAWLSDHRGGREQAQPLLSADLPVSEGRPFPFGLGGS